MFAVWSRLSDAPARSGHSSMLTACVRTSDISGRRRIDLSLVEWAETVIDRWTNSDTQPGT